MRKLIIVLFALLVSCGGEVMPHHSVVDAGDAGTTDTVDSGSAQDSGSASESDSGSISDSDTGTSYEKTLWTCLICEGTRP